ncbi:MAG: glycosyltransferase [Planctomycetes bacterium]|nr:glycosyltransferase [Planctomycetota bacterium]
MTLPKPKLSVIIASVNGLPYIDECLTALERQQGGVEAEVIVVDRCNDGTADYIREKFSNVKLIEFSKRIGIPQLRAIGMEHSTGDIIVITEDHCNARENWFVEILKAHDSEYTAVGGTVINGSVDRLMDWAVYLCEYASTMPPIPDGEVDGIAGNNVAYKRSIFDKLHESIKKDYWEYFLQRAMKKVGAKFLSVPSIIVYHKRDFGFLYFLFQRFHYSRSFAGMRIIGVPFSKRIFYILSSPLLPFLMLWRTFQQVIKKKRHMKEFLLSLPLLMIFMLSYALGEGVGYMFGPGDSLMKVE